MSNKLKNADNAGETTPANLNLSGMVNATPEERLAISSRWKNALRDCLLNVVIKIPTPLRSVKVNDENVKIKIVEVTFWLGRDFVGLDSVPALSIGVMHSGYKDESLIAFEKGVSAAISAVIRKPVSVQRRKDEDSGWMIMQCADPQSSRYLADFVLSSKGYGRARYFPEDEN